MTAFADAAIRSALESGTALLKFIAPNDTNATRSHQYGFYLPLEAGPLFTPQRPVKGVNHTHRVEVTWQDGRVTDSGVKWYGNESRHEYRITGFGRDFPFRDADCIGDLLVLIPLSGERAEAFVLDLEEDIDSVQAALGVQIVGRGIPGSESKGAWALYRGDEPPVETAEACIERLFRTYSKGLTAFPAGKHLTEQTWRALEECRKGFAASSTDSRLVAAMHTEYDLFRMIERQICSPLVTKPFKDMEAFIKTAMGIIQRRKARAGRSLENHVDKVLELASVPHQMRRIVDRTTPDIVIPSKEAYDDKKFPDAQLFAVGVKTTCKDRWRQVTKEAPRVKRKHIITLQGGISSAQVREMSEANVTLVVPRELHEQYPKDVRPQLVTLDGFIDDVSAALAR